MSFAFVSQQLAQVAALGIPRSEPKALARSAGSLSSLCDQALDAPVDSPPLVELASSARRIAVIVSDATRDEPRDEMLSALAERLPWERVTLVVASGTHRADASSIPERFRDTPSVVHDAHDLDKMCDLGRTAAGTRVRLAKAVCEADLVVSTGRLRPHYFAGYSAGVKSLFPGCAFAEDALQNHLLKADPSARLGALDDNRCRLDMEDAASRLPVPMFLLNVLCDVDGQPVAAVAGHPVRAHRVLAARAAECFGVALPAVDVLVVADRPPVTSSLYQASKLLPPASAVLKPGGTIVMLADCALGTGPLERVNQGIYELGIRPKLPPQHRVILVSQLPPEVVRTTYATPAASVSEALADADLGSTRLLFRAGEAIVELA